MSALGVDVKTVTSQILCSLGLILISSSPIYNWSLRIPHLLLKDLYVNPVLEETMGECEPADSTADDENTHDRFVLNNIQR